MDITAAQKEFNAAVAAMNANGIKWENAIAEKKAAEDRFYLFQRAWDSTYRDEALKKFDAANKEAIAAEKADKILFAQWRAAFINLAAAAAA